MRKLKLVLMLGLLLATTMALADTVTLHLQSVGVGGSGGTVYPYNFTINGGSSTTQLVCDDAGHTMSAGDTWTANVYNLGALLNSGDFSHTMFGRSLSSAAAFTLYKEAGWLYLQLLVSPSSEFAGINYAIWGLFTGSVTSSSAYLNTDAATWLTNAQSSALGLSNDFYNNVLIYTPTQLTGPDVKQELIGGRAPVPEPASLALLGTGLAALGGWVRRKHRSAASVPSNQREV